MNMKMKARRRARIREERQSLLVKCDEKSAWFLEQILHIKKEAVGYTILGFATIKSLK